MGSLDKSNGNSVIRKIAVVDVTGSTPTQIENVFNNTYGVKGWRILQAIVISNKTYLICEREV